MIAFIDGAISNTSKKWLDIEITNTFPLIALPKTLLVLPDGITEEIKEYDHVSIPADIRTHLSGSKGKIFFDATQAWTIKDGQTVGPLRLFTFVNLPIQLAPYLSGKQTKVWHEGALISPKQDGKFDPATTRMFIDFFIHKNSADETITNAPFAHENMRLAYDNSGPLLGPFSFEGLQRKYPTESDLLFTIRFGFAELEPKKTAFLFVPFKIYERRENKHSATAYNTA
ncbi:hypothetical protein A2242_03885 [Candidatus Falkowbacteria bacterium RIFOXYA2_FULL_47_9]|nr:MAG: hypothetical protein A2242_03885 [Candidatus Falkowbacteria bacterium RIFOXYA2_FULL_47_9]